MFKWWSQTPKAEPPAVAPRLLPDSAQAELRQHSTAVVFKHSRSCATSWFAQREVQEFAEEHPEIPVYTVVVQSDRALSHHIAEWTGIHHQSPQVIVFRHGEPTASASHGDITVEYLSSAVR